MLKNAKAMAQALLQRGYTLVSGIASFPVLLGTRRDEAVVGRRWHCLALVPLRSSGERWGAEEGGARQNRALETERGQRCRVGKGPGCGGEEKERLGMLGGGCHS